MNRPTRQVVYGIGLALLGLLLQQGLYDSLSPIPAFAILIGVVIGGIGAFERDR